MLTAVHHEPALFRVLSWFPLRRARPTPVSVRDLPDSLRRDIGLGDTPHQPGSADGLEVDPRWRSL